MKKKIKIKICGIKENVNDVAQLQPDYMGFIFYKDSPRNYDTLPPPPHQQIRKVGVFVDATAIEILDRVKKFELDIVQLHGNESPEFCQELKSSGLSSGKNKVEIWKVFSIDDQFSFSELECYEEVADKFLLDTKGAQKGGNGYPFNWKLLEKYTSEKPFILSGGIGIDQLKALKNILRSDLPIYAVDINSRFETSPGMKDIESLSQFIRSVQEPVSQ
jgi:phosphoribosylanthranilate isomerase